jgi:photosystem II stability/assembly factor-like uncharacterized protein
VALVIWPGPLADAHDPSSWGGLYRTRDGGATWFLANEGRFVTTALDLAVDPTDGARLLLATESGLLRSVNGGRDWEVDESEVVRGAVFAVAFAADGRRLIASTGTTIVVTDADAPTVWRAARPASGAAPARQIVVGVRPGQVYVVGWNGLLRSDDWGNTWQPLGEELPSVVVTRLVSLPPSSRGTPRLVALAGGTLWMSDDDGQGWRQSGDMLPSVELDTIVADGMVANRLWAGGADRIFRSDDAGLGWQPFGRPIEEQDTPIRGIAADPDSRALVVTTDRGLYRSGDGGTTWELLAEGVPVHLPARPLVRDPTSGATLYAGFSIRPYDAIWRSAVDGRSALQRLDAVNVGGGLAFLALIGLAGGYILTRLHRFYDATGPTTCLATRRIDDVELAAKAPMRRPSPGEQPSEVAP